MNVPEEKRRRALVNRLLNTDEVARPLHSDAAIHAQLQTKLRNMKKEHQRQAHLKIRAITVAATHPPPPQR